MFQSPPTRFTNEGIPSFRDSSPLHKIRRRATLLVVLPSLELEKLELNIMLPPWEDKGTRPGTEELRETYG